MTPPKSDATRKTALKPVTGSAEPKSAPAAENAGTPPGDAVAGAQAAPEPSPAERLAELEFTPPPRTLARNTQAAAQDPDPAQ